MSTLRPRPCALVLAVILLGGPAVRPAGAQDDPPYESPPEAAASSLLDEGTRKGENHEVRDHVATKRFMHAFEMESPYGLYSVTSRRLLDIRVHEVETIAGVVGMDGASEGLKALGQSLARLPEAAVEIVLHPIESAEKIGKGLEKTWGRVTDVFEDRPESEQEDSAAANAFAGDEKRKLAAELNLDVYSTNVKVQEFLDEIANWRAAGNLTLDVATFALPLAGYLAVSATKWRADVQRLLRDMTPAELESHNAATLRGLDIPSEDVWLFLSTSSLSPRHKTVITGALAQLRGVANLRAALLAAATARSEVGALYQEQQIELLARFHLEEQPFKRLENVRHVIAARTREDGLVVMMPADQVYWIQDLDRLSSELSELVAPWSKRIPRLHVTGRVTPRAKSALKAKGFDVVESYAPAP